MDPADGRRYFVQTLPCKSNAAADFVEREAQRVRTIRHPNLVRVDNVMRYMYQTFNVTGQVIRRETVRCKTIRCGSIRCKYFRCKSFRCKLSIVDPPVVK